MSHLADMATKPPRRMKIAVIAVHDPHWIPDRVRDDGVELVAPPAMRQSATEGMEGHRRAAAARLESVGL